MIEHTDLSYMANLYMALADKTRLRLLNLMRDREICVGYFTDILGQSQPKISRHLAYLKNSGIVEARRDGKWMHYSICWPTDPAGRALVHAVLEWIRANNDVTADMEKYRGLFGTSTSDEPESGGFVADVYGEADMKDSEKDYFTKERAHNELEDFLL